MALQKSKTLANGVTGNYWRITRINTPIDGISEVFLGLYLSQTARETNADGLLYVQTFQVAIPKDKLISGNAFEHCYAAITASIKTPAVAAVLAEDGVTVLAQAVPEGPEQNWFADAVAV